MDTVTLPTVRFTGIHSNETVSMVARESPLTVFLNDVELVTLLCTPSDMEYLAVGFLFAEGFLDNKDDIKKLTVDKHRGIVRVTRQTGFDVPNEILFKRLITSACGRGAAYYSTTDAENQTKIHSSLVISPNNIFFLLDEFNHRCGLFRETGGVHSAALADREGILVYNDDLGRHNAVDKVFGEAVLKGVPTVDRIMITSGRTPSEMILKAAKGKTPILISIGATTDLGVRLANDLGVTIIGFARNRGMIIYTNGWRISSDLSTRQQGGW